MSFSSRQGHWWRLFTFTPFSSAFKLFLHSCQLSLHSTDLYVVSMHWVLFWQSVTCAILGFPSVFISLGACPFWQWGAGRILCHSPLQIWWPPRPTTPEDSSVYDLSATCLNPSVHPQSCFLNGAKCAVPFPATENGITVNEETCLQSKHLGAP